MAELNVIDTNKIITETPSWKSLKITFSTWGNRVY